MSTQKHHSQTNALGAHPQGLRDPLPAPSSSDFKPKSTSINPAAAVFKPASHAFSQTVSNSSSDFTSSSTKDSVTSPEDQMPSQQSFPRLSIFKDICQPQPMPASQGIPAVIHGVLDDTNLSEISFDSAFETLTQPSSSFHSDDEAHENPGSQRWDQSQLTINPSELPSSENAAVPASSGTNHASSKKPNSLPHSDYPEDGDSLQDLVAQGRDLISDYLHHKYIDFYQKATGNRAKCGAGKSEAMNVLYDFFGSHLVGAFNKQMYRSFKEHATEDSAAGFEYGMKKLLTMYRDGLLRQYRWKLYRDFLNVVQNETKLGKSSASSYLKDYLSKRSLADAQQAEQIESRLSPDLQMNLQLLQGGGSSVGHGHITWVQPVNMGGPYYQYSQQEVYNGPYYQSQQYPGTYQPHFGQGNHRRNHSRSHDPRS